MKAVFRVATKDIIPAYALGEGRKPLNKEDCDAGFFDVMIPQRGAFGTHNMVDASYCCVPPFMQDLTANIVAIRDVEGDPEGYKIFHEIMRSKDLPPSDTETKRLANEAMVIMIAESGTTASTLAAMMYHLPSNREILQRLKEELKIAMPDRRNPNWTIYHT
ncbi:hypothetical protein DOTSEDRAFT_24330 [Dothistroma septosporum NZE10]|uniref:Uncharacterized protein n=1 Tax=Dothistroma septosporum (strain NZE10 / CBS 128990) TaxID=675120 RepID=N1PP89_DOTSN|nr:hypothetical protein DOTSEDRAFT_24330 [Dothistroma septosporum NZE10]